MNYKVRKFLYEKSIFAINENILREGIEKELLEDSEKELRLNPSDNAVIVDKIVIKGLGEWKTKEDILYPISLECGICHRFSDREKYSSGIAESLELYDEIGQNRIISGYVEEYKKLQRSPDWKEFEINSMICDILLESRPTDIKRTWSFVKNLQGASNVGEVFSFLDIYKLLREKNPSLPHLTPTVIENRITKIYKDRMDAELNRMLPYIEKCIKKKYPKFLLSDMKKGPVAVDYCSATLFYCDSTLDRSEYLRLIRGILDLSYNAALNKYLEFKTKLRCKSELINKGATYYRKHCKEDYKTACLALGVDLEKELQDAIKVVNKYII